MIRLVLAILFVVIYLILMLPYRLVCWCMKKSGKAETSEKALHASVKWAMRVVLFICGTKVTVEGREKLPDEPALIIPNHSSIFDVLVVYDLTVRPAAFVAKKEVSVIPLLTGLMKQMNCKFLDREDPRQGLQVILDCIGLNKDYTDIIIFPEGTRSHGGSENLAEFKEGSMKVAQKSGRPVVPVAIIGTRDVWERQFPWARSVHVTVRIGDPFRISELPKDQQKKSGAYTREVIREMLADMENR